MRALDRTAVRVVVPFVWSCLMKAPGWCELAYLNDLWAEHDSRRMYYYLGWVFSAAKRQDGLAIAFAPTPEIRRSSLGRVSPGFTGQMCARYPRVASARDDAWTR